MQKKQFVEDVKVQINKIEVNVQEEMMENQADLEEVTTQSTCPNCSVKLAKNNEA